MVLGKLSYLEVLVSKALIETFIHQGECVSVNNVWRKSIKNLKNAVKYTI